MSRLLAPRSWARPAAARLPNLFTLCSELPKYGLACRVYRKSWLDKGYDPEGHHYLITRVGLRKQLAWGVRCWKGQLDAIPTLIRQPTKREWVCLSTPGTPSSSGSGAAGTST